MARARNIKPGFFSNEDLVELDFATRLLFAGLWTVADREGRLQDRPKKIKIDVFPADNLDIDAMLQALHDAKFIQRYEVDGSKFIQIINWSKHQNPHHTEKASEIPGPNGELTVKAPLKTKGSPSKDGGNLADSLIPDSLIPDSLRDAGEPAAPAKPARLPRGEKTLKTYLDECKAAGVKPIPDDHYVRDYCRQAGITGDMAGLAWSRFREDHTVGTRKAKRYTDWPAAFANSVKDRWYRLWIVNEEGDANWTNEGLQARRVAEAQEREEAAA